jgi:hypothetical protein
MEILSTSVNNKYITTVSSNDLVYDFDEYHAKVCLQPFLIYSLQNGSINNSAYTVSIDWIWVNKDMEVTMAEHYSLSWQCLKGMWKILKSSVCVAVET